ncbi:MAG TPA: ribose-phosphate diphosphokinase [Acidobacteriaceae bacterium]|nr:ribose-phosphate diphosphokinase [Acidobacteriaceae bacterium]
METAFMLFAFPDYQGCASALESAGFRERKFVISRFANQELYAAFDGSVAGQCCCLLGSIAPPEAQLVEMLLLAHTLKQGGAAQIHGIFPYLAYSRQDKAKAGESLTAAWVGALLRASGFDRILTVDVHSERDGALFPIPINSFSPAALIAAALREHGLADATIVAPDGGAVARCQAVRRELGQSCDEVPYFEKRRTAEGIVHGNLVGRPGPRVVFVDDILDTGKTLVSACERLIYLGVEEIFIVATHGLFTGEEWKRLWSLRVKRIFCTDTVQPPRFSSAADKITVLPVVAALLSQQFGLRPIRAAEPAVPS